MCRANRWQVALAIILINALLIAGASAAGPDTLYSGNRRVVASKFYAILYFDAQHESSSNRKLVLDVMQRFTSDLKAQDSPGGVLPAPFQVVTRKSELSDAGALTKEIDFLRSAIEPDDVVFVWLECEGTDDSLELTGGTLSRRDLAERLRFGGRPRLTVLITDACRLLPGNSAALTLSPSNKGQDNHIWRALYFGHRGLVDFRSASSGQAAFTLGDRSVFATTFRNLFFTDNVIDRIDPGAPKDKQFAEWSRFVRVLNEELDNSSQAVRKQFVKPDGGLTDAGGQLPESDIQLLKAGQRSYLVPGTYIPGAR